ncbi:hypothetical protein PMZ80_002867 [Knufia obscura]|uniref:F-box domain-containing protein n=1 Tax=Knufia obscura TaxID=1635080 RepID=A0ABR0RYJ0_9EURO|nr:hypothetical protein PMZ80_002867 [Knufia obscura]
MVNTTASKGIHKLPNELLVKILGQVPFTVENFYALSDVNDRFRDLVPCPATLLEIGRRQYPDDIYRIAWAEVKGCADKIAIGLISNEGDHQTAREALTLGVHLLDYLSTVADGRGRNIVYVWAALRASLKPRTIQALRFTIGRIYDYVFTTDMNFAEFLFNPVGGTPLVEMQMQRVEGSPFSMLKRRAFETALLMKKHNQHLSDMICQKTKGVLQGEAPRHYVALFQSTDYIWAGDEDERYPERLNYVQRTQWRMLRKNAQDHDGSKEVDEAELERKYFKCIRDPSEANPAITRPFISEMKEDMAAQQLFELGPAAGKMNIDTDLKGFGELARRTLDQVQTNSLPRPVHDAVVRLRLLERVPDETQSA